MHLAAGGAHRTPALFSSDEEDDVDTNASAGDGEAEGYGNSSSRDSDSDEHDHGGNQGNQGGSGDGEVTICGFVFFFGGCFFLVKEVLETRQADDSSGIAPSWQYYLGGVAPFSFVSLC